MLFVYTTFVRNSSGINLFYFNNKSDQKRKIIYILLPFIIRADPFQDDPDLPGPPPSSLLHLRVREEDVLVRVGHSRHLPGGQVHWDQLDCGQLHRQRPPAHGGAGVPPLPPARLPKPLSPLQRALQPPLSARPRPQEPRLQVSAASRPQLRQQNLPPSR